MADPLFEFKDDLTGDTLSVFLPRGSHFVVQIVMVVSDPMSGRCGSIMLNPQHVANLRAALTQAEAALRVRQTPRLPLYCDSCHLGWDSLSGGDELCPKCERDSAVRRI